MEPLPGDFYVPPPRPAAPGWMITFADLLSLLLAFFVLLFATSSVEQSEWRRVVTPISTYFSGRAAPPPETVVAPHPAVPPQHDLAYVAALLARLATASPELSGATVTREESAAVMVLPAPAVASFGGTRAPLADLARLLSGLDNRVEVLAHGGVATAPGSPPVADWQRALARARAVAAELGRLGIGRPVAASGTADLAGGERIEVLVHDAATEDAHAP